MNVQASIRFRAKILPAATFACLVFTSSCQPTPDEVELPTSNPARIGGAEDSAGAVMPDPSSTGAAPSSAAEGTSGATDEKPLLKVTRLPVFRKEMSDGMKEEIPKEGGPEVIPIIWDNDPIPLKVIAEGGSGGLAVVDFYEGVLKVYRRGDHLIPGGYVDGVSVTPRGGLVVTTNSGSAPWLAYFPDSDLSKQPVALRPRINDSAHRLDALADQNDSLVWMLQYDYRQTDTDQKQVETWVDLVDVDTGEAVMTADIEGHYRIAGIVDEGLLLDQAHVEGGRGIYILDRDGDLREVTVDYEEVKPFWIVAAHGQHFALKDEDREIVIIDTVTNGVHPIAKPEPGAWTTTGIPDIPTHSLTKTQADEFIIGFRPTEGDWSLYAISLASQSVRKLGEYDAPPLGETEHKYLSKPLFSAVSVAGGGAVLAFTGWKPTTINIVNDTGGLIPVVNLPDGYYILDAA